MLKDSLRHVFTQLLAQDTPRNENISQLRKLQREADHAELADWQLVLAAWVELNRRARRRGIASWSALGELLAKSSTTVDELFAKGMAMFRIGRFESAIACLSKSIAAISNSSNRSCPLRACELTLLYEARGLAYVQLDNHDQGIVDLAVAHRWSKDAVTPHLAKRVQVAWVNALLHRAKSALAKRREVEALEDCVQVANTETAPKVLQDTASFLIVQAVFDYVHASLDSHHTDQAMGNCAAVLSTVWGKLHALGRLRINAELSDRAGAMVQQDTLILALKDFSLSLTRPCCLAGAQHHAATMIAACLIDRAQKSLSQGDFREVTGNCLRLHAFTSIPVTLKEKAEATIAAAVSMAEVRLRNAQAFLEAGEMTLAISECEPMLSFPARGSDLSETAAELTARALLAKGDMHNSLGDLDQAFVDYARVMQLPNISSEFMSKSLSCQAKLRLHRGDVHLKEGRMDAALKDFEGVIELADSSGGLEEFESEAWSGTAEIAELLLHRGDVHLKEGRMDAALKDYERVIDLPDSSDDLEEFVSEAWSRKAELQLDRATANRGAGRRAEAIHEFEIVASMSDAPPYMRILAISELADAYSMEEKASAMRDCRQTIDWYGWDCEWADDRTSMEVALARILRGTLSAQLGEYEESLEDADRVLAMFMAYEWCVSDEQYVCVRAAVELKAETLLKRGRHYDRLGFVEWAIADCSYVLRSFDEEGYHFCPS